MKAKLSELVGKVPGLISADFVTDPAPSSTHEVALVTTFEKVEDIAMYAKSKILMLDVNDISKKEGEEWNGIFG